MSERTPYPRRPLVALTRGEADNASLGALLASRGLRWVSAPCVSLGATRPPEELLGALRAAPPFAAVAFPSRRAVEALLGAPELLQALGLRPDSLLVAAVGPGTAQALRDRGWPVALVPEDSTGAALAAALADVLRPGARVLLPGGDRARPELPDGLSTRGLEPVPLQVYAHTAELPPPPLPEWPDVVVCASPSAAQAFLAFHPGLCDLCFVAIGPTTEAALRDLGVRRVTRASGPTNEALARAVSEALKQDGPSSSGEGPQGETP